MRFPDLNSIVTKFQNFSFSNMFKQKDEKFPRPTTEDLSGKKLKLLKSMVLPFSKFKWYGASAFTLILTAYVYPKIQYRSVLEKVKKGTPLNEIPEKWRSDREIVLTAIKTIHGNQIQYASNSIRDNLHNDEELLKAISHARSCPLNLLPEKVRDMKEYVRSAVWRDPNNLEYASKRLQEDPEINKIPYQIERMRRGVYKDFF